MDHKKYDREIEKNKKDELERIEYEKTLVYPTNVKLAEDVWTDPPYTFTVKVKCSVDLENPYYLTFDPETPYKNCTYVCPCCDTDFTFTARDIHENGFISKTFLKDRPPSKSWFHESIFNFDIEDHDIYLIEKCDKIETIL